MLERTRIFNIFDDVSVEVKKKSNNQKGTTPYYFSYSFKGEQKSNPIKPGELEKIAEKMNEMVLNYGQTLIAMDRGGTALGVALSIITRLPLFIAFSYREPPEDGISWHEPGGGKYLGIPKMEPGNSVILIDDEINTGKTLGNAINCLVNHGIKVDQVLVVVQVERQDGLGVNLITDKGISICSLGALPEPVYDQNEDEYFFPIVCAKQIW